MSIREPNGVGDFFSICILIFIGGLLLALL